jgi:hypothetical protein
MLNGHDKTRFLVVGPPRGGFTLLLSILNIFYRDKNISKDPVQETVNHFIPVAAEFVDRTMINYFKEHLDIKDVFYSKEFKILVGGPKWMDDEDDTKVCVRKYLGVRDMGDFTFIQYVPKFAMDFDDVIHSHNHPKRWIEDPYYRDYLKFASIRNPVDIIHSSVYSINALTSEYIQRCITENDRDIRLELALNKLTNLEFMEGLVKFLKKYLDEFIPVKDCFLYVMRWEDLILEPVKTIMEIAERAGMGITESYARKVWKEIDHRNLTRYHMHSFRKGVMHDWKNSITNSHLELFKKYDFNDYLKEFGYPEIEFFNVDHYTPVQKTIEEHIKKGEVYRYRGDDNLYTFAFNKSNFLATGRYQFKTYPRNGGIKIERSMFRNETILRGFIEAMGPALSTVSDFLVDVRSATINLERGDDASFKDVEKKYHDTFSGPTHLEDAVGYSNAFGKIKEISSVEKVPRLVDSYKRYNIVKMNRRYYGVPQSLGPLDLQSASISSFPQILSGQTIVSVMKDIDKAV